ncbi:hypothetical protein PV08_11300 [Exophiala spinifera]|uniref:Heterokaryon incompatibility domain-containing protein n=1 Tax=Exophiala spinifera TaxID=91928 RepID=A0A0D2AUB9_9EURO|nr:uncharacterized protein PV08_11300 [Exophiala spinifera]KIW10338.1 hypothetical protein PV08_11300 [Exophiala spinifera]
MCAAIKEPYLSKPLGLDDRSIRLLIVHPPSTSDYNGGPLKADLMVVQLDHCPVFSALSCVWGVQASAPMTIECGGVPIKLTDNCHSALQHLRRRLGSFTIWVDVVAINQDDDAEKSKQIPLMSAIYQGATEVFIWLGDGNDRTDRAMAYLEAHGPLERGFTGLANKADVGFWSALFTLWSLYITRWMPHMHRSPPKIYVKPTSPKDIWYRTRTTSRVFFASAEDIAELLDREWIKRIWTYQELMLASNPIVICGNRAISWSHLAMKLTTFHYTRVESTSPTLTAWRRITLTRHHVQALLKSQTTSDNANRNPLPGTNFWKIIKNLSSASLV